MLLSWTSDMAARRSHYIAAPQITRKSFHPGLDGASRGSGRAPPTLSGSRHGRRTARAAAVAAGEHGMVLPRPLLWPRADHDFRWSGAPVPARIDTRRAHAPRREPLASCAGGQVLWKDTRDEAEPPRRDRRPRRRRAERGRRDGGAPGQGPRPGALGRGAPGENGPPRAGRERGSGRTGVFGLAMVSCAALAALALARGAFRRLGAGARAATSPGRPAR